MKLVDHITPILNVSNLDQSFAWFEKLGWKKRFAFGEPPGFGAVKNGSSEVFLCLDGQGSRGGPQPRHAGDDDTGGTWMSWWVPSRDDVDRTYALAQQHGFDCPWPPTDEPWGVRECHIRHPDGHTFRVSCGDTTELMGELTAIRERLVAAENAGDPRAFEELLSDDAVIIPPGVPPIEGKAACIDFVRGVMAEVKEEFASHAITLTSAELVVTGDLAFDRGTYVHRLTHKDGPGEEIEHGSYVWLYWCRDGAWRVARIVGNITERGGDGAEECP